MTSTHAAGAGHLARRRWRAASVGVAAVSAVLLTGCSSGSGAGGPSTPSTSADDSYGALPTFLPSTSGTVDSVLTGSAARPALTVEGDAVAVQLHSGRTVRAQVDGPLVPGEGLPHQAESTTCTWTVTLSGGSSSVAVRAADFTSIDHLGHVFHPGFVPGQPAPPATLAAGARTTFELRTVMPTGEGLMRWAPDGGPVLAQWDFEVEID